MHDHGKVVLNATQLEVFNQFSEALKKSHDMIENYDNGAIAYEHAPVQVGYIAGLPVSELRPTGNIKVCPACLTAMPVLLREMADIYEELAAKLDLPEAKAKTKFGV